MITPPRYKVARRLGPSVYEKTLSPKFALRMQQKSTKREFSRPKTDYGMKMLEKQRVRFTYGVSEKQFSRYVGEANESSAANRAEVLHVSLEPPR
jgi:small subunit ribosomal protein S4